jgi:hypothetical protein
MRVGKTLALSARQRGPALRQELASNLLSLLSTLPALILPHATLSYTIMPNNFLDQDYGSEDGDDDFNPATVVESDHENDEAPHDGRRGERTGGDKTRSSGDRDKRVNGSRDTRNHEEDDNAIDEEGGDEDESDGDQDDDDEDDDDDDAAPVRSSLT